MNAFSNTAPGPFADDAAKWAAVQARDPQADAWFVYSVATTGVFCRPSCAARPALRRNVAFHADAARAAMAGFRPCKRCRPDEPARAERDAALIARACRLIEAAEEPPTLAALAGQCGLSPHHFHRLFRAVTGVTPRSYAAAQRQARVHAELSAGEPVTAALYAAGFNSSGRFYEASDRMLGMTPTRFRAGGVGELIRHTCAACSLGTVLVAMSSRGICAILLGDSEEALAADLRQRFPRARCEMADEDLRGLIAQVVRLIDDPQRSSSDALPLDIRGTAFQRRVWETLQAIPVGETRSYGAIARQIGQPRAARAVATACASNMLAVAIPCHRVIPHAPGDVGGYRWGSARKRELLKRERQPAS